jgi:acetate kinase
MKLLVINAGSSSLKFRLFETIGENILAKGLYDGLGERNFAGLCRVDIHVGVKKIQTQEPIESHENALDHMAEQLISLGVIRATGDIIATAHRVVHGGEKYRETLLVDDRMLDQLRALSYLAPLHNPINVACIEALKKRIPGASHYAVFDTAFHQTMPEESYLYGLPYSMYKSMGIRKYGFHGTNHQYAAEQAANILKNKIDSLKIITCHLGNGQSVCAVKNGRSVDTSMGFTPLEGLPMGTRSGSFDPEIILFLLKNGYDPESVERLINKESGLLGISGISSDYRSIEKERANKNEAAIRTHRIMVHRITSTIGAFMAIMGGTDAIVFTGGIGENAAVLRSDVLSHFKFFGLCVDEDKNLAHEEIISTDDSFIAAMVVPANEELQIVREVVSAMRLQK